MRTAGGRDGGRQVRLQGARPRQWEHEDFPEELCKSSQILCESSQIKAGTRIKDPDLNGLRLLRDRLGDRFAGGFVLNLGELAYRKESKIAVMPLSALWSLCPARKQLILSLGARDA